MVRRLLTGWTHRDGEANRKQQQGDRKASSAVEKVHPLAPGVPEPHFYRPPGEEEEEAEFKHPSFYRQ